MKKLDRRVFLQDTLAAATAVGATVGARTSLAENNRPNSSDAIIDTNVYMSRWPFRRLMGDDTASLVKHMRSKDVTQAWVGSYDGVFHKDVGAANARLFDECRVHGNGMLVPFGSINPKLPDWEEELRRCQQQYQMPGIRLHPNYHQYALNDPDFGRLLSLASQRGMVVQVAAWLEDERHQNPLMPAPEVDMAPLTEEPVDLPGLKIQLLNTIHVPTSRTAQALLADTRFFFDIARLELIESLSVLLKYASLDRILFGSYSPMFYFESARLKLEESDLDREQSRKILAENARRLLAVAEWKAVNR